MGDSGSPDSSSNLLRATSFKVALFVSVFPLITGTWNFFYHAEIIVFVAVVPDPHYAVYRKRLRDHYVISADRMQARKIAPNIPAPPMLT